MEQKMDDLEEENQILAQENLILKDQLEEMKERGHSYNLLKIFISKSSKNKFNQNF